MSDFRTRLIKAYSESTYAEYGNGGVIALAESAGLGHNTVYLAMAGKKNPNASTRKKLARALDLPESAFTETNG